MIRFRFRSKKPITNDIQIISNTNEESKLLIRWLWVTPAADILSSLKKNVEIYEKQAKIFTSMEGNAIWISKHQEPIELQFHQSFEG